MKASEQTADLERQAFQIWFKAYVMPLESDWFKRDDFGYIHTPTEYAWQGWSAKAKASDAADAANDSPEVGDSCGCVFKDLNIPCEDRECRVCQN